MKLAIIVGERPAFIRLVPTIRKCKKYFDTTVIWTDQNFDKSLSTQFFDEFNIKPDVFLKTDRKVGIDYMGAVMPLISSSLKDIDPDCVLVLGDTNASFTAVYVAKRMGYKVFHLEAGNRCYDPDRVPEEVNRYCIDSISDWHLCYTQRAREQLLLEGKKPERVIVVGNPLVEMVRAYETDEIYRQNYFLVTLHRKENINDEKRLEAIFDVLERLPHKVNVSKHPSLANKVAGWSFNDNIELFTPSNFTDFLKLEKSAVCIITDSGGVPEEAHLLGIPCVLLRYSTERPELLESNNMVVCSRPEDLNDAIQIAIGENSRKVSIPEYHQSVSSNIVKILMRYKD